MPFAPNPDKKFEAPFDELLTHFKTMYAVAKALGMHAPSVYSYASGKVKVGGKVKARIDTLLETIRKPTQQPQGIDSQTSPVGNVVDPYFGLRLINLTSKLEKLEAEMKETKESFVEIAKWAEAIEKRVKVVFSKVSEADDAQQ